jgi:hypothetical protein
MIPLPEFVHLLRKGIDERMAELAAPLVEGQAIDFASYKQQAGVIVGLREARQQIDDLIKRVNEGPL